MFSYVGLWIAVGYPLIVLAMSLAYYFKFPQYHNARTLLAVVALTLLALTGLLLLFVQPYLSIAARADSRLSASIAIFTLTMVIFQALVLYPQSKRQGRRVFLVSLTIFAIVATIYAFYTLYTIITSIFH